MFGIEYLFAAALITVVGWLLNRTNKRTSHLPRMPFGVDADSEAAAEYRRELAELRQIEQLFGSVKHS